MTTEYGTKALESLDSVEIQFGDASGETNKLLATAIVYALLDVARAIRSK